MSPFLDLITLKFEYVCMVNYVKFFRLSRKHEVDDPIL